MYCLHFISPNMHVLMYNNIDTLIYIKKYSACKPALSITTSLPISFLKRYFKEQTKKIFNHECSALENHMQVNILKDLGKTLTFSLFYLQNLTVILQ